jgi:hypothetical protein
MAAGCMIIFLLLRKSMSSMQRRCTVLDADFLWSIFRAAKILRSLRLR